MKKATEIYALISENPDEERLVGALTPSGWVPMVFLPGRHLSLIRPEAQKLAEETGKMIRLVRFTSREDLETFLPPEHASI